MFLIMGVTLYTSRVILQTLGIEDYGIYNIVGGIVALFTSISSAISSASTRYITISLSSDDVTGQRKVFSTCMIIHLMIALLILILCETVGLYFFYEKLVIPEDRIIAAFWTYQFSILAVLVFFMGLPYNSVIIAHERMDVYAYISIFDAVLRLVVVYAISWSSFDKLIYYAFLLVLVQLLVQGLYYIYCSKNTTETSLIKVWDCGLIKRLFLYTFWILIGCCSMSIYTQGQNVLLNVFWGPLVNAAQGIAVQVQMAFLRLAQNIQTVLRPQMITSYAEGDITRLQFLLNIGTKLTFYLMLLVGMPILFNVKYILGIWLVDYPQETLIFTNLLIVVCMIRSFINPLMMAIQASENIKGAQLLECLLLLALPISYVLVKFYRFDAASVFWIDVFVELLLVIARIIYILPRIGVEKSYYIKKITIPTLAASIFSLPIPFYCDQYMHDGLTGFLFMFLICITSTLISITLVGFNKEERKTAYTLIISKFRKV